MVKNTKTARQFFRPRAAKVGLLLAGGVTAALAAVSAGTAPADVPADQIKVLLIGGQNNHDWKRSTPFMQGILEKAGHFKVAVNHAPEINAPQSAWDAWQPKFKGFDCVVSDYNGQMWPDRIKQEFVSYVASGGGVVVIHAANNSFGGWKEYEQMVGLLWRGKDFGYSLYLDEAGKLVRENPNEGRGMGHGGQYDWIMTTRDPNHAITSGMPLHWMHKHDELYHGQRGPAENIHILLTAYSDPAPGNMSPLFGGRLMGRARSWST